MIAHLGQTCSKLKIKYYVLKNCSFTRHRQMAQDIQKSNNGDSVAVTGYVAVTHYPTRPRSVLKLYRAESTSASHLHIAPVNSFKKITISVVCQPASKWAGQPQCPQRYQPERQR